MKHIRRTAWGSGIAILCAAILAAGAAGCLAGCGKKVPLPVEGGTFISGLVGSPTSLDPAQLQDETDFQVAQQIYEGLTSYDPETMEAKPAIAVTWDVSGDQTVFTFHLKPGVTFHNGDPCVASDFVYSWNRAVQPATQAVAAPRFSVIRGFAEVQAGTAQELSGVLALDDLTLQVTLVGPFADFPALAAHPCFAPVPRRVISQVGDAGFSDRATGTGPFKLNVWERQNRIVLDKNPEYYGTDKAHLDQLIFKIYPDANSAYVDFTNGLLQDAEIPAGRFADAVGSFHSQTLFDPLIGIVMLGFNMNAEPWKSHRELRQALNYAVNREAVAAALVDESRVAATGLIPQGMPGYQPDAMPYTYDPARAADLLRQAGYPGGQGLPGLTFGFTDTPDNRRIAEILREELSPLGINLVIQGYDPVTYVSLIQSGQLTFFRFAWRPDYPIGDSLLFPLFFSGNAGGNNLTGYSNPEVDGILDSAPAEGNASRRLDLYRTAQGMILDDAPVIPLLFHRTARVIGGNVQGYIRTARDDTPYKLVYLN